MSLSDCTEYLAHVMLRPTPQKQFAVWSPEVGSVLDFRNLSVRMDYEAIYKAELSSSPLQGENESEQVKSGYRLKRLRNRVNDEQFVMAVCAKDASTSDNFVAQPRTKILPTHAALEDETGILVAVPSVHNTGNVYGISPKIWSPKYGTLSVHYKRQNIVNSIELGSFVGFSSANNFVHQLVLNNKMKLPKSSYTDLPYSYAKILLSCLISKDAHTLSHDTMLTCTYSLNMLNTVMELNYPISKLLEELERKNKDLRDLEGNTIGVWFKFTVSNQWEVDSFVF